jgi:hypothetical protein
MRQVLCTFSNDGSDVRCSICGQGFIVYWSRFTRAEQEGSRRLIQNELRNHHAASLGSAPNHAVHPRAAFSVPAWADQPSVPAGAMLVNAPSSATEMIAAYDEPY